MAADPQIPKAACATPAQGNGCSCSDFLREYLVPAIAMAAVALLLFTISPRNIGGDSVYYLVPIIRGTDLYHPHHLLFAPLYHYPYRILAANGLASEPYFVIRSISLLIGAFGVFSFVLFFRAFTGSRAVAMWMGAVLAVVGTYWQFAAQFEGYTVSANVTTFACFCLLLGLRRLNPQSDAESPVAPWRVSWLWGAAVSFGLATCFHQGYALISPVFVLFALCAGGTTWKRRLLAAVFVVAVAGALSLAAHAIAWALTAAEGTSFFRWLTRYANIGRKDWGTFDNVSERGILWLRLTWLQSWCNFEPAKFYEPLTVAKFGRPSLILFWVFCALFAIQAVLEILRKSRYIVTPWVLLWLLIIHGFELWWTPTRHNFKLLTLLPQLTLVAMPVLWLRQLADALPARTPAVVLRSASSSLLAALAAALFIGNMRFMIIPGMKQPLAPLGTTAQFEPWIDSGDVGIFEWTSTQIYWAFVNKATIVRSTASPADYSEPKLPPRTDRPRRYAIQDRVIFEEATPNLVQNLGRVIGDPARMRGMVLTHPNGLAGVVLGTDSGLPLASSSTISDALLAAARIDTSGRNRHDSVELFALAIDSANRAERRKAEIAAALTATPPLPRELAVPLFKSDGSPAWAPNDAVTATPQGTALALTTLRRDAILHYAPPRLVPMHLYDRIVIDITLEHDNKSITEDTVKLYVGLVDRPLTEGASLTLQCPVDGQPHRISASIANNPILTMSRATRLLRLDPARNPGTRVVIRSIKFVMDSPGKSDPPSAPVPSRPASKPR